MDAIDKINLLLIKYGMSGAELEREIGVSHSVYSQWNTKTTKPSNRSLAKVAKVFGIDVTEILPDEHSTKKEPTPKKESGQGLPEGYDKLTPENKAIVDRLIVDLANNQSRH